MYVLIQSSYFHEMQCPLDIANNTDCLKVIAFTQSQIDGASKNNFECMDFVLPTVDYIRPKDLLNIYGPYISFNIEEVF